MTEMVLELATIKLSSSSTESALLAASEVFQTEFLSDQDGFVRRDMVRKEDGTYLDVILWQSRAHADAVFARAQSSPVAGAYFGHMDFDPTSDGDGVEHCTHLRAFSKG